MLRSSGAQARGRAHNTRGAVGRRQQLRAIAAPSREGQQPPPVDQAAGPLPAIMPPPLPARTEPLHTSRQGSVEPYTLVEGPGTWYAADYQHNIDEWAVTLTPAHVAELNAAVAAVLASNKVTRQGNYLNLVGAVSQADFPLPTLGPLLHSLQQEVLRGRGFALLRGLPVEEWSRTEAVVAWWGIGLHWGRPVRQNAKGHLIGHVKDVGVGSKVNDPCTRIYLTSAAQPWHVDGADLVGLLCLKTAKSGGLSSWSSSVTIHNELLKRDPEIVRTLAGTWYLDRKNEIPDGKLSYFVLPIIHYYQGFLTTTFNDSYYQAAQRHAEVPRLTAAQLDALEAYRQAAASPAVRIDYQLAPGDMQLLNNHTTVHTRSAFDDYEDAAQRRHLLRLWVAPSAADGAMPLHPQYAEAWASVEPGARGGVYVPGNADTIPLEAEFGNKLAT